MGPRAEIHPVPLSVLILVFAKPLIGSPKIIPNIPKINKGSSFIRVVLFWIKAPNFGKRIL